MFILIPNEAHHGPGEEDESRYLNQPFVPKSVTITPGTNVVWFNGDVGHEHNIVISDGSSVGAPVIGVRLSPGGLLMSRPIPRKSWSCTTNVFRYYLPVMVLTVSSITHGIERSVASHSKIRICRIYYGFLETIHHFT